MTVSAVYTLDTDVNRYASLEMVREKDWDRLLQWLDAERIGKRWTSPEVELLRGKKADRLEVGDFPYFGAFPAFSSRAVEALRDLLQPNGEILPLRCKEGDYYAYNVTMLTDALDEAKSSCSCFTTEGKIQSRESCVLGPGEELVAVTRPTFRPKELNGLTIFKLRQEPRGKIYVIDEFVSRVQQKNLAGFKFEQVWPREPTIERKPKLRPPTKARMPKINSDRALTERELGEIAKSIDYGYNLLRLRRGTTATAEIQKAIFEFVNQSRAKPATLTDKRISDLAVGLGCLWGQSLCDALGWEWRFITFGETGVYAVASPSRSHVVIPMEMIRDQLEKPGERDNSTLLLFNMLSAGQTPKAKARQYMVLT